MAKTNVNIGMGQQLSRKLLPLATAIALLIAVLAPVTYWLQEHRKLQDMADIYAEDLAEQLRLLALESPSLWKYQTYKFNAIAEGFHPAIAVSGFRILDEKGELISGHDYQQNSWEKPGKKLSFMKEPRVTLGAAPIIFNDRQIGTMEVLADDTPIVQATILLFIFCSLLGTGLALLVYRFPVRVVRTMEGKLEGLLSDVEQSEERYRSLVEESLVGVYIIVDGIFKYVNPKMTEIFGWTFAELTDKKGPVDLTLPEDWPTVEGNLEKRVSGEISSIHYEFRGVTKDRRVIFLEVFGCRTIYQGKPAVIGTLLDISERKRAEEALNSATEFARIVMDSIDDAISIVDVNDYRIIGCNASFLKKIGLSIEDALGKRCYELTHHQFEPCSPPFDHCPLLETVTTRSYAVAEHTHFQKNGDKVFSEVATSPIFDGNGAVVRVVHVARDITERKRTEEKIRRLNEELELQVEERTKQLLEVQEELVRKEKLSILGQLSGSVGHEMRNPLGVMSNAVYFLQMVHADADETTREYLDIIKKEIDNALQIITDLLDFARTKPPQQVVITPKEVVQKILARCTIPENIAVAVDLPDGLPKLNVDPQQLGQVLTNVITNGVQAMPQGGVLRVAARGIGVSHESGRQNPADYVEISVTDNGEGITPENMTKLFQPLFTTKARGIGLGLVVCKNLVEANGGRIEVESEAGKGTTFMMMLPTGREKI